MGDRSPKRFISPRLMVVTISGILAGMRTSLERLLAEAIDFDARAIPTAEAVANYAKLRRSPVRALVGRFVCSARQLPELIEIGSVVSDFEVAVSASASPNDRPSWEQILTSDVAALNGFLKAFPDLDIGSYQIRVPDAANLSAWITDLNGFRDVDLFVEIPDENDLEDAIAYFAETEWVGAMLGPSQKGAIARFVQNCLDLEVPFKLSRISEESAFLTLLSGATLCRANDWTEKELDRLLQDPDPRSLTYQETGLMWRSYEASLDDIDEVRSLFRAIETSNLRAFTDHLTHLGLARWTASAS